MFIMQVGGKVGSILNSWALHSALNNSSPHICIFSAGINGLIFSKCDSGLCSGQLWALNSQRSKREKKKKFQHTTSLVAASENPWMRNFFFQSCFAVDKFIPRGHSAFKLLCVWFLVCVTIASKICEQEDGEISWSPSPHIKMAECLVMLTLH